MSPVPTKGLGFDGKGTIERECLQQSVYVISAVGLNNMRGPDVIYKRIPWLFLIESKFRKICKKKVRFQGSLFVKLFKRKSFSNCWSPNWLWRRLSEFARKKVFVEKRLV